MESKKKDKIDYKSVNKLVVLSKRTIKIIYYIMILLLIVLISEILHRWNIFPIIVDILTVILPLFIGFIIAWLLNPLIKKLSKKMPKVAAVILVYIVILAIIGGIIALIIPNLASEIKDLVTQIPSSINDIETFITNAGNKLSSLGINGDDTKKELFTALTKLGGTVSNNLATYILNTGKGIINVVAVIALSIIIAVYLSIDFDKIRGKVKKLLKKK